MDNKTIFVAQPDQSTTGMVLDAPLGTALPTGFDDEGTINIDSAFTGSGYVSEDGVSLSPSWETTALKDMSGATVRTMLDEFTGEITFSLMNLLDAKSAQQVFGEDNVVYTPTTDASQKRGNLLNISIGATLPPERSWIFKMKDGNAKVVIVVPKGQITALDSVEFNKSNSANLSVTLTCTPDSKNKSIYIYCNDGRMYSATSGSDASGDDALDGVITWKEKWEEMTKADIYEAAQKGVEKQVASYEKLQNINMTQTKSEMIEELRSALFNNPADLRTAIGE